MLSIDLVSDKNVYNFLPAITFYDLSGMPEGGFIISINWIGYSIDFDYGS